MCGLAGFTGAPQPDVLGRAVQMMHYRGPDERGRYEDSDVSLGHCRLSIIDLAHGQQPMTSADGRYVLAFNGEIYNFRELRKILESEGLQFRTCSDTEVLLGWLVSRGRGGLQDLNGMFALALWDKQERRLLLARDRLGIKPLYVSRRAGNVTFGSEIKAILVLESGREPNLHAILQFITFQNVLSQDTFFKGITKLPAGGWMEWTPQGIVEGKFWSVRFDYVTGRSFGEIIETYRAILDRAVTRHMIADVPVGTYLSGGIDSSSVTCLAARHNHQLHTFTGAFIDAPYYDERQGSRAVARSVGATLHEVEIEAKDFSSLFGRIVFHLDEPTLGTGALPQFVVARLASEHVKVVLTGHGGDEAFAGYQVSKAVLLRDLLPRWPARALRHMARVTPSELSRVLYFSVYPLFQPEVGYGLFIMTPRNRRGHRLSGAFLDAVGGYEPLDEIQRLIEPGMSRAEIMQSLYLKTYLPTLFLQEDKIGMAHSLESRTPLCDNELIDFALGIDFETKLHGGELKAIPRRAMRSELPPILYSLPKRGFPTPYAKWFRQAPIREMLQDLLLSTAAVQRGIYDSTYVSGLLARHLRSDSDTLMDYARASELYSIALVELWFRTFIDQPIPAPVN
jgi:asparagine synthase (glutamine-hydrolysing)